MPGAIPQSPQYLPPDLTSSASGVDDDGELNEPVLHQGRMDRLVVAVGDLLRRRTKSVSELDEGFRHVDTIKHSLTIIYSDLLWSTVPIFKTIDEEKKRDNSLSVTDDADMTEADPAIQRQILQVCQTRSTLEEALISVLEMHLTRAKRPQTTNTRKVKNHLMCNPWNRWRRLSSKTRMSSPM